MDRRIVTLALGSKACKNPHDKTAPRYNISFVVERLRVGPEPEVRRCRLNTSG